MSAEEDLAAGLSPEELIPGDLVGLESATLDAYAMAEQLADTRRGLAYIDLDGKHWTCQGAEAYHAAREIDLTQFARAVTAFDEAEAALAAYAGALIEARTQARTALADYRTAKQAEAQALAGCHNPTSPATTANTTATPVPLAPTSPVSVFSPTATDPYGIQAAVGTLVAARDRLDRVATSSAQALTAAADLIPQVDIPRYSNYTPGNPFPVLGRWTWNYATSPYRFAHGWGTELYNGLMGLPGEASPPGSPQRAQGDYDEEQARQGRAEMTDGALDFVTGTLDVLGAVTILTGGEEAAGSTAAKTLLKRLLTRKATEEVGTVTAENGSGAVRSVEDSLADLPKGKQPWVRMVPDEDTLAAKFDELTRGGTPTTWKGFNGTVIERGDGVQVGMRGTSRSGGGAIDIRMPSGSRIRIHVEQP